MVLPQEEDIIAAAKLKSAYGLSYADAFAGALAMKENAPVITGDPELRELAEVVMEWIGSERLGHQS
jgi:ribonuclease VapC